MFISFEPIELSHYYSVTTLKKAFLFCRMYHFDRWIIICMDHYIATPYLLCLKALFSCDVNWNLVKKKYFVLGLKQLVD